MKVVPPAITIAQIDEPWIDDRREVIIRDGYATQAGAGCSIEIKSLQPDNAWRTLALPGGAISFTTEADRDAVLKRLQEGAP